MHKPIDDTGLPSFRRKLRVVRGYHGLEAYDGDVIAVRDNPHIRKPRCPPLDPSRDPPEPARGQGLRPVILGTGYRLDQGHLTGRGGPAQGTEVDDEEPDEECSGSAIVEGIVICSWKIVTFLSLHGHAAR